jgi:hypothetical protein
MIKDKILVIIASMVDIFRRRESLQLEKPTNRVWVKLG